MYIICLCVCVSHLLCVCVYECVCACAHVCVIYMCMYISGYIYIYTWIHMCEFVCECYQISVNNCINGNQCVWKCVYVCVYVYIISMCVCRCACICCLWATATWEKIGSCIVLYLLFVSYCNTRKKLEVELYCICSLWATATREKIGSWIVQFLLFCMVGSCNVFFSNSILDFSSLLLFFNQTDWKYRLLFYFSLRFLSMKSKVVSVNTLSLFLFFKTRD